MGAIALLAAAVALVAWIGVAPSHDRVWLASQAVLPRIDFEGDVVHVRGVRNFAYRSAEDFTPSHDDRSYDLRLIESVWFGVSPFSASWRGPAHVFLAFSFADSQHVAISVEARREVGEEYSVLKGMLRRYELIYVVGDERDIIGLRTVVWGDPVHFYPTRATPDQARRIFVRMLERAEGLRRNPEFYNTVTNNCTSNIVAPVNEIATDRVRFGLDVLLPGYSDRRAHRMGLLDTDLALDDAREAFLINERARASIDGPDFSARIRGR